MPDDTTETARTKSLESFHYSLTDLNNLTPIK